MKFKYAEGTTVIHNRTGEKGIVRRVLGLNNEIVEVNTLTDNTTKQWIVSGVQVHTVKLFCDEPDNFLIADEGEMVELKDNDHCKKLLEARAKVKRIEHCKKLINAAVPAACNINVTFKDDVLKKGVDVTNIKTGDNGTVVKILLNPAVVEVEIVDRNITASWPMRFIELTKITFKEGDVVKRKGRDLLAIVTNQDCITDSRIIRVTNVDNSDYISLWLKKDIEHFNEAEQVTIKKAAQCGHTSSQVFHLEYKVGDSVLHVPTKTNGIVNGFLLPSSEKISVRLPHLNDLLVEWRVEHMEKNTNDGQ